MSRIWLVPLVLLAARCGGESSAQCAADKTCNPQCAADPDCGKQGCDADKFCNPKCPVGSDMDCGTAGCVADGDCNAKCPAGSDPDCVTAKQAVWPGFNGAAGTMTGKNYRVTGALVPGEYGKTASGTTHKVDTGIRRNTE